MFHIRPVYDDLLPGNRAAVQRVQAIFRESFSGVAEYADKIQTLLHEPFTFGYRTLLLVAEQGQGRVCGFSLFLHSAELRASLLDFIAVDRHQRGGGVGKPLLVVQEAGCSLRNLRKGALHLFRGIAATVEALPLALSRP